MKMEYIVFLKRTPVGSKRRFHFSVFWWDTISQVYQPSLVKGQYYGQPRDGAYKMSGIRNILHKQFGLDPDKVTYMLV